MRRIIYILIFLGFKVGLGQPEIDFLAQIIKDASVDSCNVTLMSLDGSGQLHSKLSFNSDGTVHTESFPTSYSYAEDSIVTGFNTYVYQYDSLNRLNNITSKARFKMGDVRFDNYSNEHFVYNEQGQLIAHLFYASFLEKVVAFHYKDKRLVSEITTQNMESSKKNYTYSNDGKVVTTCNYNHQGTLLDSLIEEVDSLKFSKRYVYYEYQPNAYVKKSPQHYFYQFDSNWKVQKIRHYYDVYESFTTFFYNEKGLLERSEFRGVEKYDFVYIYKFNDEHRDDEK